MFYTCDTYGKLNNKELHCGSFTVVKTNYIQVIAMKLNKNMKIASGIFLGYLFIVVLISFYIFDYKNEFFTIAFIFTVISFLILYSAIMYYLYMHEKYPEGKADRIYAVLSGEYAVARMLLSLIIIGIHEYFGLISFIYYGGFEILLLLLYLYRFARRLRVK